MCTKSSRSRATVLQKSGTCIIKGLCRIGRSRTGQRLWSVCEWIKKKTISDTKNQFHRAYSSFFFFLSHNINFMAHLKKKERKFLTMQSLWWILPQFCAVMNIWWLQASSKSDKWITLKGWSGIIVCYQIIWSKKSTGLGASSSSWVS